MGEGRRVCCLVTQNVHLQATFTPTINWSICFKYGGIVLFVVVKMEKLVEEHTMCFCVHESTIPVHMKSFQLVTILDAQRSARSKNPSPLMVSL